MADTTSTTTTTTDTKALPASDETLASLVEAVQAGNTILEQLVND